MTPTEKREQIALELERLAALARKGSIRVSRRLNAGEDVVFVEDRAGNTIAERVVERPPVLELALRGPKGFSARIQVEGRLYE